jgi:Galactose oxidase, central domain
MHIWSKVIQVNSTDLYFIGGLIDDTPINKCYKYNIRTKEMTKVDRMLIPRSAFGMVLIKQNIYALGGSAGGSNYI